MSTAQATEMLISRQKIANAFFSALYPEPGKFHAYLWTLPGKVCVCFDGSDENMPKKVAEKAISLSESGNDVYYGLCTLPEACPPQERGKNQTVISVPGLGVDIDICGPTKSKEYPTEEEARTALLKMPLSPSLLIHSGGGYHAYWLFHERFEIESLDDRRRVASAANKWQQFFRLKLNGKKLDTTKDLARVFRVPGTTQQTRRISRRIC